MSTINAKFQQHEGRDWRRGLGQVLKGELSRWFGSRRWLVQIVVYALLIFPLVLAIMAKPDTRLLADGQIINVDHLKDGVEFFNATLGIFGSIGVVILMEGAILGEKRSGTAAWTLSKPVSRSAFLFAKLFGNSIGIFMCAVLAENVIFYLLIASKLSVMLSPLGVVAAMLPQMANLLFYMTLTLMLAVLFNHRGVVIGIPLLPLFLDELLVTLPPDVFEALVNVLPYGLIFGYGEAFPAIGVSMTFGTPIYSPAPIYWTLFFSVAFVTIAVWAFRRQEL